MKGELIIAGDIRIEQPHSDSLVVSGYVVQAERSDIKSIVRLPMYEQVEIVRADAAKENNGRLMALLIERDRWKANAEEKIALRTEIEEMLGVQPGPPSDEQLNRGVVAMRKVMAELAELRAKYEAADQAYNSLLAIHGTVLDDISILRARVAELLGLLQQMIDVWQNCDETGYADGVGFVDIDALYAKARAAIDAAKGGTT